MRSRRSVLVLLLSAAVLSACGGGGNDGKGTETALAPTTTVGQTSLLTSVATTALPSPAPPTTLAPTAPAPTTLAPTTPTPTTVAAIPTTTRQAVTLPPGVTEADRIAAEAAAIGWWKEFYRQLLALPDFDPQAILKLTVEGRPAGPAMLEELEKRRSNGFAFRPGVVDQTVVLDTRVLSRDLVEVQFCLADDGSFVQRDTGKVELAGLGRSFYLTVVQRSADGWKIDDWGSFRNSESGLKCE